jgi:hypothetical protein
MKLTILLILLVFVFGCVSDNVLQENQCTERIITIGLPDQMIKQGREWVLSMPIEQRTLIEKCYALTRENETSFKAELLC